jgi:hypothetical protein
MDVVARRFGPKDEVIANVLLDEAIAVVTADHRIGQVHVFDLGLQLAAMMFADPATEDHGDLVGLADRSIGIEQPLLVQRRAAMEDEVVAELDLRLPSSPLASRFRKGKSGNAKGRPRGRCTELPYEAVLGQEVTIRENGRERRVTAAEAFLPQLTKRGLDGDSAAALLRSETFAARTSQFVIYRPNSLFTS